MDRILYKEADGDITCRSRDFDKVFPTLYAYEETGLTPEEISAMKDALKAVQEELEDLRENFIDSICDGYPNPANYCKNRTQECVDARGYCINGAAKCKGFYPGRSEQHGQIDN